MERGSCTGWKLRKWVGWEEEEVVRRPVGFECKAVTAVPKLLRWEATLFNKVIFAPLLYNTVSVPKEIVL